MLGSIVTTSQPADVVTTAIKLKTQTLSCTRSGQTGRRGSRVTLTSDSACYGTDPAHYPASASSGLGDNWSKSGSNIPQESPESTVTCDTLQQPRSMKPPPFKRQWQGVAEVSCNVVGTLGFVLGSLLWCVGVPVAGTYTFCAACALCGISCVIYTIKFYLADDGIGVYALLQQAIGCFLFIIASFLYLDIDFEQEALRGFLIASFLFLTGCILTQVQCRSWLGVLAPLYPKARVGCLPTSLCNTAGSVLFVVGSLCLFYPVAIPAGCWLYEIGSILFFLASWGDAIVWWNMGCTQSEHQQVSEFEAGYANVKYA